MKHVSIKTKPGSPVLLSADDMRRIAQRTKPTDKTILLRTVQGTILVGPFARLEAILGYSFLTDTRFLSGIEPKKWDGALIYYAGIEFDGRGKPIVGKTNPIVFGALVANITDGQLQKFLTNDTSAQNTPIERLWYEGK